MMDEMIVQVKDIGPIDSQLAGDFEGSRGMEAGGFSKKSNFHAQTLSFGGQTPGMGQAVNDRLMTIRELTLGEIKHQPFEAAHIEIIDELNDAHVDLVFVA
jgi:hypothetical protein